MKGLESIASALFEKIRGRFPKVVMGDETGAPTSDEAQARFFDFDYIAQNENQGAVSVSIKDPNELKLYYSQNMLEDAPESVENDWYNFLKEMRFFAKKHLMSFDARDIAKANLDKRDYQYLGQNKVQESAMYGTSKSSYENLDKTRLIIRHKKEVNQEAIGARTRHIESLFVENESGERFKYPFNHLAGGRAMARHVANGGLPHDEFGKHIVKCSEDIAKLTAFKRYVQHKDFMNSTSNDIIEGATLELENLRTHIKKLQGQNYYKETFENYITPESVGEFTEDNAKELKDAFTIPQFNEDLTDMFPLLHTIYQKKLKENEINLDEFVSEDHGDEVDSFFRKVANSDDGFDMLYAANSGKYGDAIYKAVSDMYNDVSTDHGYHPDDDFEEIYDRMIDQIDDDYGTKESKDEFESWADDVVGETVDKQKIAVLNKLMAKHFPVGADATNAIESLKGIIDDEQLNNELKALADKDPDSCARPLVHDYLEKNDPELLNDVNFGDMKKPTKYDSGDIDAFNGESEDDTTDVTIDKDGAMKLAGDDKEPKDEKASTEDIIEFVRSFYDKETGAFPKGETGVVISARKRFGDSVGDLVEKFVSKLTGKRVQVEDEVNEGGNAWDMAVTDAEAEITDSSDEAEAIKRLQGLMYSKPGDADEGYANSIIQKYIDDIKQDGLGKVQSYIERTSMENTNEAKKAKPDFLDMDKDGNKKEPMKKAIKDKEKKNESQDWETVDNNWLKDKLAKLIK